MSQDLSTLRNFFAFGRWASRTILESVAVLTPEEYARPIGGSFGSVQGTLVHLSTCASSTRRRAKHVLPPWGDRVHLGGGAGC
jgi:uncharacterized damage-inducible protein DinB